MLKLNELILFILLMVLSSCEFNTPTINGDSTSGLVNLRSIRVECLEDSFCKNNLNSNYEAYAFYTNNDCREDILNTDAVIARATAPIVCESIDGCFGEFENFKAADGVDDKFIIDQNVVNLLVFIDINMNEALDLGEPVNCNEGVELRIKKNNSDLQLVIDRLF